MFLESATHVALDADRQIVAHISGHGCSMTNGWCIDFCHVVAVAAFRTGPSHESYGVRRHLHLPYIKPCRVRVFETLRQEFFQVLKPRTEDIFFRDSAAPAQYLAKIVPCSKRYACGPFFS